MVRFPVVCLTSLLVTTVDDVRQHEGHTMTPPPADDRTDRSGTNTAQSRQGGQQAGEPAQEPAGATGWFASAALRTGLIIIGFVLLLFALGQAVGFNLLDLVIDAVTSPMGRWIVVAIFALLLIAVAGRGLNRPLFGR